MVARYRHPVTAEELIAFAKADNIAKPTIREAGGWVYFVFTEVFPRFLRGKAPVRLDFDVGYQVAEELQTYWEAQG